MFQKLSFNWTKYGIRREDPLTTAIQTHPAKPSNSKTTFPWPWAAYWEALPPHKLPAKVSSSPRSLLLTSHGKPEFSQTPADTSDQSSTHHIAPEVKNVRKVRTDPVTNLTSYWRHVQSALHIHLPICSWNGTYAAKLMWLRNFLAIEIFSSDSMPSVAAIGDWPQPTMLEKVQVLDIVLAL